MLNFLGIGSAFNTELGNTSAFIKNANSLILIDCGGTVFHQLRKTKVLNGVEKLDIIITHTHPDHIGSLGEVIFYANFILKIKPTIYYPELDVLKNLFHCTGVTEEMVNLLDAKETKINDSSLNQIRLTFIPVRHLTTVTSFGLLLEQNNKTIYYSGDANMIPDQILNLLEEGKLEHLYQDTCGLDYEGNAHLSLNKLCDQIPRKYRSRVFCMHLDEHIDIKDIKEQGFNIPMLEQK